MKKIYLLPFALTWIFLSVFVNLEKMGIDNELFGKLFLAISLSIGPIMSTILAIRKEVKTKYKILFSIGFLFLHIVNYGIFLILSVFIFDWTGTHK